MARTKLTQRNDGRYKTVYKGKQFYGKTQKEAIKKRDEYIANERAGLKLDETSLVDYGLKWLGVYRTQCNSRQLKQYENMIRFTGERLDKPLCLITATDLQSVVNSLSVYSASHIDKFLTTLRGIFKTAAAEGSIARNPMELVKRPKCKKTEGHRALEQWERDLICSTYCEHDFGPVAMLMLYAGLRRGEALYIDIDRDVDFDNHLVFVRGAVSFSGGNQPTETEGKTVNATRTVPLAKPLADALRNKHGLISPKKNGELMSETAFNRKYESYITFLETKLNGCHKRWYGRTKEHKELIAKGQPLPPWKEVTIRCHDFRVDFCTRCYYADIPPKVLQSWMGHSSMNMILNVYAKLTKEEEEKNAAKLTKFFEE